MATLTLGLVKTPRDELTDTVDGDVPEWTERLYQSYGTTADSATTGHDEVDAAAELERAGVWVIARQHAPHDGDGNVRWSRRLFP